MQYIRYQVNMHSGMPENFNYFNKKWTHTIIVFLTLISIYIYINIYRY